MADDVKAVFVSRMSKVQFFFLVFVILQVTVFNVIFQWSGFGELVSAME